MTAGQRQRIAPVAAAAVAAASAAAIGFACGSATRTATPAKKPAAAEPDDASGILGQASRDLGTVFGGDAYGRASYGGASYAIAGLDDEELAELAAEIARETGVTYGGPVTMYGAYEVDFDLFQRLRWRPKPSPYHNYTPVAVQAGGAIEGEVTWRKPPEVPARIPIEPALGCGARIDNRSLEVDRRGRVEGAVVYLRGIRSGRALLRDVHADRIQLGGTVEVGRDCQMWPRVHLVAPVGATLRLIRGGRVPRAVSLSYANQPGAPVDVELGERGQARQVELSRAGFLELAPSEKLYDRAWVIVAGHPYYAVTGEDGRYRLDEIPPGSYELVVWHPPVFTGFAADGSPEWRPGHERTRRIRVKANGSAQIDLRLD